MGATPSCVYIEYPDLCHWKRVFEVLNLSNAEVRALYGIYHCMDVDESDTASIKELVVWLASNTPFMFKVFSLLDIDKHGTIEFGDFVVLLWNFCALRKNDLSKHPSLSTYN